MKISAPSWLSRFLPSSNTVDRFEKMRAVAGAVFGLFITGSLGYVLIGHGAAAIYLIAPMGASAVLLFCVPASPLAQPWSVIGGNLVSAAIGVTCAKMFGDVLLAATLAGSLAIAAMFALRCLHPPSGAVALTAVLGGPLVHAAGYGFVLLPVGLNSVVLVAVAIFFNNATGRRYPHSQQIVHPNVHATKDIVPTERLGFTSADLEEVLQRYNQVLDVSRDDLEEIFLQTEMHAYQRRFGLIRCVDIMSKDAVTTEFDTSLDAAWRSMRAHRITALPVLNRLGSVIGIVTQSDFLEHWGADDYTAVGEKLRRVLHAGKDDSSGNAVVVGDIMSTHVKTANAATPITNLVPLMADSGLHHIPVIDDDGRFVGIVTQSDLVAGLYESRLAQS